MIDSSRHFLPLPAIKRMVDAMAWVKLNVLHWHLVDDEAFPMQFLCQPTLWEGAYSLQERYTKVGLFSPSHSVRYRGGGGVRARTGSPRGSGVRHAGSRGLVVRRRCV